MVTIILTKKSHLSTFTFTETLLLRRVQDPRKYTYTDEAPLRGTLVPVNSSGARSKTVTRAGRKHTAFASIASDEEP